MQHQPHHAEPSSMAQQAGIMQLQDHHHPVASDGLRLLYPSSFTDVEAQEVRKSCCKQCEAWRAHVAGLVASGILSEIESRVLHAAVDGGRPVLHDSLISALPSSSSMEALQSLLSKGFLRAKRLSDGTDALVRPSESVGHRVVYYPGTRLVEWVQQEEQALPPLERALGIIDRRTRWFYQERDRLVLEKWRKNQCRTCDDDPSSAEIAQPIVQPPIKRMRTSADDAVEMRELAAARNRKIEALHRYNEAKDYAHQLLGQLAERYNLTVRDLYKQLGIDPEDTTLFL